jgi:hypothetical protein
MKKLLLLPLVAIGLALVPAKQADAQVSRTTLGGRTTTAAIDLTSTTSIIITATKADGLV